MSVDTAAARALADAATPGPWESAEGYEGYDIESATGFVAGCKFGAVKSTEDAEFIAASRSLVPALCDEVDRLRAEAADLRNALGAISELTVADRPFDWRIYQIQRVVATVRALDGES